MDAGKRSTVFDADTRRYQYTVETYSRELQRLALRLARSHHDAEDLLQDVFTRLYVHRHRLAGIDNLRAWLYRVVYFRHLERRRQLTPAMAGEAALQQLAVAGDADSTNAPTDMTAPEEYAYRLQLRNYLICMLDRLSPAQRAAVEFHDLQELTLAEVAARLGLPMNTLKSQLVRARRELRRRLTAMTSANAPSSPQQRLGGYRTSRSTAAGRRSPPQRATGDKG